MPSSVRLRLAKFTRLALGAIATAAIAGAMVPILGTAPSPAASSTHPAAANKTPKTPQQLQAIAVAAQKRAAAARTAADKARTAAAIAEANLRQAEAGLSGTERLNSIQSAAPSLPQQQSNYAVNAAQSQLMAAQQAAQQAQFGASLSALNPPKAGAPGAFLGNIQQTQAQNSQAAVLAAQRNLDYARQTQNQLSQTAGVGATLGTGAVHTSRVSVASARRIALAAERAAKAAELNAQTLAEDADRAIAAAKAAVKGGGPKSARPAAAAH